jgi:hypothetical protein
MCERQKQIFCRQQLCRKRWNHFILHFFLSPSFSMYVFSFVFSVIITDGFFHTLSFTDVFSHENLFGHSPLFGTFSFFSHYLTHLDITESLRTIWHLWHSLWHFLTHHSLHLHESSDPRHGGSSRKLYGCHHRERVAFWCPWLRTSASTHSLLTHLLTYSLTHSLTSTLFGCFLTHLETFPCLKLLWHLWHFLWHLHWCFFTRILIWALFCFFAHFLVFSILFEALSQVFDTINYLGTTSTMTHITKRQVVKNSCAKGKNSFCRQQLCRKQWNYFALHFFGIRTTFFPHS